MPTAPINRPKAVQCHGGDVPVQLPKQPVSGTNTPLAYQFVVLNSGLLRSVQTDGTSVYGLSVDDGTTSTTSDPYDNPFANYLYPLAVRNQFFVVNITDGSGTVGSGTTTQGAVSVGSEYALIYGASPYTTTQMLDASDTTNKFFKVMQLWPEDATTDFNGRVIVTIASTATIQS